MLNKKNDVLYCGVSKDKISRARPILSKENVEHLYNWISERYKIHLKKDILEEARPWTKNYVLLKYRFCNVRREHDKESRWLIKNIANSDLSYENKLLNCILFRLINKSKTIEIFGSIDFFNLDIDDIRKKLLEFEIKNPDYVYFSGAFFMSGPKVAANKLFDESNMVVKIILLVKRFFDDGIIDKIKNSKNQKEVYLALRSFNGLGEFLSYQILVDFSYILEFPFSENEFTIAGPGCKKGLDLVFKNRDGLTYEELLFWLRDNQEEVFSKFGYNPEELFSDLDPHDRTLNIMSLENCMCEISKYIRAIGGNGRPRVRYIGM